MAEAKVFKFSTQVGHIRY